MPADSPPTSRAPKSTSIDGAKQASRLAGIASVVPIRSIILRP